MGNFDKNEEVSSDSVGGSYKTVMKSPLTWMFALTTFFMACAHVTSIFFIPKIGRQNVGLTRCGQ